MSPKLVEVVVDFGDKGILSVDAEVVAVAALAVLPAAIFSATALAAFLRLLDSLVLGI